MTNLKTEHELDCRGLNCPMPVIKTKQAMDALKSEEILKMMATDPGSAKDMNSWARQTGNTILASKESQSEFTFYIQKN
ncbi:MAG: transcriptional regulator [bacterium]|nr:MAG: transcriptional regulator [bacterium]